MINKKKLVIYIIFVAILGFLLFKYTGNGSADDKAVLDSNTEDLKEDIPEETVEEDSAEIKEETMADENEPSEDDIGSENMIEPTNNRIVTIETDKGDIKFEIYEKEAPITSKNFLGLVEQGFYDGLTFHRVEPGFVIQGGDPNGDGTGGSENTIPLEINQNLKHVEGAVAMARAMDPNSASSQYYITLAPQPSLDGQYAVFGKVIEGMDVVKSIAIGDKMNKVTVSA